MDQPADLLSRPPEEGARLIALSWLDQAAAAFPRLRDPADTEALHDFRVGLRRLRSCLRSYRAYLEESLPKKLRRRLRDLAASTGPGRDTEVQIEWLRGRSRHLGSYHRAGLTWILGRLEERMRLANEEMSDQLPREFPRLEADLRERLSTYHTEINLAGPSPTLAEATAAILRSQAQELESHLALVDGPEDEHEAHEARISAKRLRYLLEPFDRPEAVALVKKMKKLQEILGELHDAHVLEAELSESLQTAASERVRRLLELSLSEAPDDALIRAEQRRVRESGLLALARLNRGRRNRLFEELEAGWLEGRGAEFFAEAEAVAASLEERKETIEATATDLPPPPPEPIAPSTEPGTRRPRFM